jgi:hypothetical protein
MPEMLSNLSSINVDILNDSFGAQTGLGGSRGEQITSFCSFSVRLTRLSRVPSCFVLSLLPLSNVNLEKSLKSHCELPSKRFE